MGLPCCSIKEACQRSYTEDHFLHISAPAEWVSSGDTVEQEVAWEGRLRKLMRRTDRLEAVVNEKFHEQSKKFEEQSKKFDKKFDDKFDEQSKKLDEQGKKLDMLLELLKRPAL